MNIPIRPREIALSALFFLAITALFFYPQISTISTALIGPAEDNMQQYWYLWHGIEAILRPDMPLMHTKMIYYPTGIGLFYISYYYWSFWIALLLKPFLSYIAIYNFLVLHSFVVGGVGAYCLTRYLGGDWRTGLVAGFVFAFSPNHFARSLHHVHVATIYFAPLFFLFFLKSIRENKIYHKIIAGLLLAGWGFCDWGHMIYGLIFLALASGYFLIKTRKVASKEILSIVFIGVVAVICALPLAIPMAMIGSKGTYRIAYTGHDTYVVDLLGFLIPHYLHGLASVDWIRTATARMTGTDWEKAAYFGIINIGVIVAAWRQLKSEHRKYIWALLVAYIFALGSHLHILGNALPIVLPNKIIEVLPFITNARNPARIIVWAYLFLSILVAFSMKSIFFEKPIGKVKKVVLAAIVVFMFLDFYSIAKEKTPIQLPACYKPIVADKSGDFGIMEFPYEGARYQAYQTLHGIPTIQGYVNRRFEVVLADTIPFDPRRLDEQKPLLVEGKIKYIVIHKKRLDYRAYDPKDKKYYAATQKISNMYATKYPKIYEDDSATTLQVYS